MIDHIRARKIVKLAAKYAPSAKSWLINDERGTWEQEAGALLESTATRAAAMGLTPAQVDDQIALKLGRDALMALLGEAKKPKAAKAPKRRRA